MMIHPNLDDAATRAHMEHEVESDVLNSKRPTSRRLTAAGASALPDLVLDAVRHHDDAWLAQQLACCGRLKEYEVSHVRSKQVVRRVPKNAAQMIAEAQVRRFYFRALAVRAQSEGKVLEIVRGKRVSNPRPESLQLQGLAIDPVELYRFATMELEDPNYDGPFGPNSGLTVALAA